MLKQTLKGALIASAVASMLSSGAAFAKDKGKETAKAVRCSGINECKGKGECAGGGASCKGQNECKGKGNITVKSEKECTAKGGKVVAEK